MGEELQSADDVAQYLELEPVTIYRWCRDGRLTCMKLGKVWRIRRSSLDAFLRQAEQPRTLVAHLGTFLELPDQVLAQQQAGDDRPLWVNLNWRHEISLETALRQQAELAELVATHLLAVMTGVVEPAAEMWPPPQQWQLLGSLRGVIRFSQTGLMLSRVVPPPTE
jgi:excisionase family DNA binding protein